jgi:hypothetical protein
MFHKAYIENSPSVLFREKVLEDSNMGFFLFFKSEEFEKWSNEKK